MTVLLSSEMQKLIDERIRSGKYASADQVLTAALVSLDHQERFCDFAPGELDRLLAEGERSIKQHGTLDGEKAFQNRQRHRAAQSAVKRP